MRTSFKRFLTLLLVLCCVTAPALAEKGTPKRLSAFLNRMDFHMITMDMEVPTRQLQMPDGSSYYGPLLIECNQDDEIVRLWMPNPSETMDKELIATLAILMVDSVDLNEWVPMMDDIQKAIDHQYSVGGEVVTYLGTDYSYRYYLGYDEFYAFEVVLNQ